MPKFDLAVIYEMYGVIKVEADSLQEAIEKFNKNPESFPPPIKSAYVEWSYGMDETALEYTKGALQSDQGLPEIE